MSEIAVIGEAVADALVTPTPSSRETDGLDMRVRPGGGPANTAVALARLGTPARFLGRLGRGPFGDLLRAHLAASGVDLSASVSADEQATLAVTALDGDGRAAYDFYATGTADWQWSADELRIPAGAACVHTGSMALVKAPGGPLIERALAGVRERSVVSIDPNVRPRFATPEAYRTAMERWIRLADILRLSEEDLAHLDPYGSVEDACAAWHAAGVALVVITRGGDGAVASLRGTRIAVPALDIDPVDTVGAGDAFTAGLLHHLWRHDQLHPRLPALTPDTVERAMRFAAEVAGRTCLVPGADPPWAADLPPCTTD